MRDKKIKKTSLAGDAIYLSVARVITTLLTLIVAMLLSRYLTKTEYGTYSSAYIAINLVVAIFTLGLPHSITYFLSKAETQHERSRLLSVHYTLATILSLIAGLILVLGISAIIQYFSNPLIRSIWFMLAIMPWSKMMISILSNTLIAYQRTKLLMTFKLMSSLSVVIIIVICGLIQASFITYITIYIIIQVIITLTSYAIIKKCEDGFKFSFDKELIKTIFKFSIPIGLATMVGIIDKEFDKLFIGNVLSTEELATYANAAKELPLTFISMSFISALLPRLTRLFKNKEMNKGIQLWGDCTVLSFWFLCYCSFAICVFAPDVITFLYSDKYISGVNIFRIYTALLMIRCTYFGMVINALGHTKYILYSSIAEVVVNIILNFVLYYTIGTLGPAIATVISNIFAAIILLIITSRKIDIRFAKVFPFRNVAYITVANIVLAALFYYGKIVIPINNITGELLESIFLSLVWGGLVFIIFRRMIVNKYKIIKSE